MMEPFFTSAAFAAFIATGMISLAPNIILFLMPGYAHGSGDTSTWLALGQAIGAGGLLADVFLHTLPESSNEASGIYILVGFTIFFAVDLMVRSVNENHGQHNTTSKTNAKEGRGIHVKTTKRSIVLLNLVADALHNFTDGLAIGASYSMIDKSSAISSSLSSANVWSTLKSHSRGGFATLSICFHEIPHELSDFCTLVRAGYSTRQAIAAQLFTAIAAFAGTATAVAVSSESWMEDRLLWITAGGFVYLAGTTMLPEVLNDEGHLHTGIRSSRLVFRLAQLFAFTSGIFFMSLVDWLSDEGHDHHHHHHHDHVHSHTHEIHEEPFVSGHNEL